MLNSNLYISRYWSETELLNVQETAHRLNLLKTKYKLK